MNVEEITRASNEELVQELIDQTALGPVALYLSLFHDSAFSKDLTKIEEMVELIRAELLRRLGS